MFCFTLFEEIQFNLFNNKLFSQEIIDSQCLFIDQRRFRNEKCIFIALLHAFHSKNQTLINLCVDEWFCVRFYRRIEFLLYNCVNTRPLSVFQYHVSSGQARSNFPLCDFLFFYYDIFKTFYNCAKFCHFNNFYLIYRKYNVP